MLSMLGEVRSRFGLGVKRLDKMRLRVGFRCSKVEAQVRCSEAEVGCNEFEG